LKTVYRARQDEQIKIVYQVGQIHNCLPDRTGSSRFVAAEDDASGRGRSPTVGQSEIERKMSSHLIMAL
jgi:hypothetical protein